MPNNDKEKTKSEPKRFNLRVIALLLIVLLATIFIWHNQKTHIDCTDEYRQDTFILSPSGQEISVEIVESPAAQAKGLSGRSCIDENWGMLFSFEDEAFREFWMKDMNFSLDIIWLDGEKFVVDVTKNISPETYPEAFTSNAPSQYVLEMGAGQAEKLGLTPKAQVNF